MAVRLLLTVTSMNRQTKQGHVTCPDTMKETTPSRAETHVLSDIPFELTVDLVIRLLKVRKVPSSLQRLVEELVARSLEVARPKAMFRVAYVDEKTEDGVVIDGHAFQSSVLRQNLDGVERVFPFVATCGIEADGVENPTGDLMTTVCLDTIRMHLLVTARRHIEQQIKKTYALDQLSRMAPGSLPDWPVQEQGTLFRLLGEVEQSVGVRLTDKYLMLPLKSVSGIFFPTEVRFESCQLCPRASCIGRRAPYDPELAARYGVQA